MKVHELAKELGVTSKDLIPRIRKLGSDAKSHMSVIDDEVVQILRNISGTTKIPPVQNDASEAQEAAAVEVAVSKKSEPVKESKDHKKALEEKKELEVLEQEIAAIEKVTQTVQISFPITVGDMSKRLSVSIPELIKALMGIGVFANVNQLLNEEIGFKLAGVLNLTIEKEADEVDRIIKGETDQADEGKLKFRSPVVTMMGHVDHGKTSLLDAIRKTNVAAHEKGFITQHIGAYSVDIPNKGHVTFLDTPGHEAFTAMRARGANITDVVVLVVAADDGVMPQTVEALDHAREAGCPIVVAINKCDLPSANYTKVLTGLQKVGLMPEEWGGKTVCVKVSAKTRQGIDELLELLILESEILELKANPDRTALGTVIEGHISKGSGSVATVIVQKGTLHPGDTVLCGQFFGKVRALKNEFGKSMKEAGPSYAAELLGLNGVPEAGETFVVVENERVARQLAEKRALEIREREMRGAKKHLALEDLYEKISEGNFKELKLIIKADVQGSVEALKQSLEKLTTEKCSVRVVHGGTGGINESDVVLAAASDAIVIGFHVKADTSAEKIMDKEQVDVRYYNIIYEAVEDVRKAMEGLLEPTLKEVFEGRAEIRKVFSSSKVGTIGGAFVVRGKLVRNHHIRLVRDNVVIFEGKFAALRRFKDDVREVAEGYECGISLHGFNDIRPSDTLECYRVDKIAATL